VTRRTSIGQRELLLEEPRLLRALVGDHAFSRAVRRKSSDSQLGATGESSDRTIPVPAVPLHAPRGMGTGVDLR
jgi:hypothetical protein